MNLKRMIRASAVAALLVDEHGVDRSSQPHDKYDAGPDAGPDAGSDAGSDAEPQPQGPAGRHRPVPQHPAGRAPGLREVQRHQRDQLIAEPGMGAMGVHFVNGDLVGDPAIIPDPSGPSA